MKFSLFAHMERVSDQDQQRQLYEEFLQLCQMADEGGMHAIWTGEHHGMNFTISPNPLLNLVDIARRTKNVRLGTGTIIAPFWHPIKLAGEAAMTDMICDGRLELGVARGAYSFEYERLVPGMDAWQAGQRLRELVPAVKALWAGDYSHEGEFWQFPQTTSSPAPLQAGGPPVWVAARDPSSHEFALQQGCNVQVTPLWLGDEEVETLMQRFNDACDANPDIPRPKIMLLNHTYVGSDEADIQRGAEELNTFYNYFGAWFKNERPISQGQIKKLSDEEIKNNPMFSPETMRRDKVVGLPGDVIARLKNYEKLGYDEYAFWIDSGMSFERKRDSLKRFIDGVMPAFDVSQGDSNAS